MIDGVVDGVMDGVMVGVMVGSNGIVELGEFAFKHESP